VPGLSAYANRVYDDVEDDARDDELEDDGSWVPFSGFRPFGDSL
jgi:hypothetical protein